MADYQRVLTEWPDKSTQAVERLVKKYGPPDDVTSRRMIWHHNGPWKRTEARKEPIRHDWPMPHDDMVEMTIDYQVPVDRMGDLGRFDGSVVIERTLGELSARCEAEEANFLALNLADEIVSGKKSVDEARQEYAENMRRKLRGDMGKYMKSLLFEPAGGGTGDPDEVWITEEEQEKEKAKKGSEKETHTPVGGSSR